MHLEDTDDEEEGKTDKPSKPATVKLSRLLHRHENGARADENENHVTEGNNHLSPNDHHDMVTRGRNGSIKTQDIPASSTLGHSGDEHDEAGTSGGHHRHHKSSHARRSSVSTARSTIFSRLRSIRSKGEGSRRRSNSSDSISSHSSSTSASSDMMEPAYRDPSTHVNIMTNKHKMGDAADPQDRDARRKEKDLSHHTFFIENSQMRLKLVARTEVSGLSGLFTNLSHLYPASN
jgi:hypothetical protein